jgi:hypothetical protein
MKPSKRLLLKNKSEPFIYRWVEKSTGKWYVGSRTARGCHQDDGYICSSVLVYNLILSNPDNWVREILESGNDQSTTLMREREILISLDARSDPMSYNDTNAESNFVGSTIGKICINDGKNEKFVSEKLVDSWISMGWQKGRLESKKKQIGDTISKRRSETPEVWTSLKGKDNSSAKNYKFTSPSGKEYLVMGEFKSFCKNIGISPNTMIKALKEGWIPRRGKCSGWKVENLTTGKSTKRDTLNYGESISGDKNPYYGGKNAKNK